jgi:hypothetical protein
MPIRIPQWLFAVVLLVLLVLPCAVPRVAEAQAVGVRCADVKAGGYRATHVFADFTPCRTARAKLRRWLARDRLPRSRHGWNCYQLGGVVRACSYPGKRGARRAFTFWLRRPSQAQADAATWKRCGNWSPDTGWTYGQVTGFGYFNVRALRVSCRTARRLSLRSGKWDYESAGGGRLVGHGRGRFSAWTCYLRFAAPPEEATFHLCRAPGGRRVRWISAV